MTLEARGAGPGMATHSVDADNPWPGLVPFSERDRGFFRGRGQEIDALESMVMRGQLTVLFSQSGLGKSSLLQAGLFPRLRNERVLPIYIRLDFSDERPDLVAEIREAITRQAEAAGAEAPTLHDEETLWEAFHRRDALFWDGRNRPVMPLLVFDQFEEIFTLGRQDAARMGAVNELIRELSWLAEGTPPPAVKARLEEDPDRVRDFDFRNHHYKLLFALREDYLADLEELRDSIPSIALNRLRLRRMNGRGAQRVVWLGAPHLIDLEMADPLVRFVANAGEDENLDEIEVEPALLSVVCRKLNDKRREKGERRITRDLLEGSQQTILDEFYESSVKDLGHRVRNFVEKKLLTDDGHRDSIALDNALNQPGVTQAKIDELVNRRLVRIEESAGATRVELTHDLLLETIAASRARRERRKASIWTVSFVTATVLLFLAGMFFRRQYIEAQRTAEDEKRMRVAAQLAQVDDERAREEARKALRVLLELQRPMRHAQENPPALLPALASALDGALTERFAHRLGREAPGHKAILGPRGVRVAKASPEGAISIENADGSGDPVLLPGAAGAILSAAWSSDGSKLAAGSGDGTVRVWSTEVPGDPVVFPGPGGPATSVALSAAGTQVVAGYGSGRARLWSADGSGRPIELQGHEGPVQSAAFDRSGRRIITGSEDDTVRVWSAGDGEQLDAVRIGEDVWSATFSPDGERIVTASSDHLVRVYDAEDLSDPIELQGHEGPVVSASFTAEGARVVSASVDGTVRLWRADGEGSPVVFSDGEELPVRAGFLGDEKQTRIYSASRTGRLLAWPAPFDAIRSEIEAEAPGCLTVDFRRLQLDESREEAQRQVERCEAMLASEENAQ